MFNKEITSQGLHEYKCLNLSLLLSTCRWCCLPRHGKQAPNPIFFPQVHSWAFIFFFSKIFSVSTDVFFKWSINFYNPYLKNCKIILICASQPRIDIYMPGTHPESGVCIVHWSHVLYSSLLLRTQTQQQTFGLSVEVIQVPSNTDVTEKQISSSVKATELHRLLNKDYHYLQKNAFIPQSQGVFLAHLT